MVILIYDFGGNNFKNMLSSKENSNNKKKTCNEVPFYYKFVIILSSFL